MPNPNLLPEEIRDNPEIEKMIDSLKTDFRKMFDNCINEAFDKPKSPVFANPQFKPFVRVYLGNIVKTAFDQAYFEFITNMAKE